MKNMIAIEPKDDSELYIAYRKRPKVNVRDKHNLKTFLPSINSSETIDKWNNLEEVKKMKTLETLPPINFPNVAKSSVFPSRSRTKSKPKSRSNSRKKLNIKYLKLYEEDEKEYHEEDYESPYMSEGEMVCYMEEENKKIQKSISNFAEISKTLLYLDNIPNTHIQQAANFIINKVDSFKEKKNKNPSPRKEVIIHNVFFRFIINNVMHKVEVRNQLNQVVSIDNVVNLLNNEIFKFKEVLMNKRKIDKIKKRKLIKYYPSFSTYEEDDITNKSYLNISRIAFQNGDNSILLSNSSRNKKSIKNVKDKINGRNSSNEKEKLPSEFNFRLIKKSNYKELHNNSKGVTMDKGTDTTTLTNINGVNTSGVDISGKCKDDNINLEKTKEKDVIFEKTNEDFNGTNKQREFEQRKKIFKENGDNIDVDIKNYIKDKNFKESLDNDDSDNNDNDNDDDKGNETINDEMEKTNKRKREIKQTDNQEENYKDTQSNVEHNEIQQSSEEDKGNFNIKSDNEKLIENSKVKKSKKDKEKINITKDKGKSKSKSKSKKKSKNEIIKPNKKHSKSDYKSKHNDKNKSKSKDKSKSSDKNVKSNKIKKSIHKKNKTKKQNIKLVKKDNEENESDDSEIEDSESDEIEEEEYQRHKVDSKEKYIEKKEKKYKGHKADSKERYTDKKGKKIKQTKKEKEKIKKSIERNETEKEYNEMNDSKREEDSESDFTEEKDDSHNITLKRNIQNDEDITPSYEEKNIISSNDERINTIMEDSTEMKMPKETEEYIENADEESHNEIPLGGKKDKSSTIKDKKKKESSNLISVLSNKIDSDHSQKKQKKKEEKTKIPKLPIDSIVPKSKRKKSKVERKSLNSDERRQYEEYELKRQDEEVKRNLEYIRKKKHKRENKNLEIEEDEKKKENQKRIKEFLEDQQRKDLLVHTNEIQNGIMSKDHNEILHTLLLRNNPNFSEQLKYVEGSDNIVEEKEPIKKQPKKNELVTLSSKRIFHYRETSEKGPLIYDNLYLYEEKEEKDFRPSKKIEALLNKKKAESLINSPRETLNSPRVEIKEIKKKKNAEQKKPILKNLRYIKERGMQMKNTNLFFNQMKISKIKTNQQVNKVEDLNDSEIEELKKQEKRNQLLKEFFDKIKRLKNSNSEEEFSKEITKLIDEQIENTEYAKNKQKESRLNNFVHDLNKFRNEKDKMRKSREESLKYKSPLDFYLEKNLM